MVLFIVFIVNAVNLTDGIDGLAASVTFVTAIGFMLITMIMDLPAWGLWPRLWLVPALVSLYGIFILPRSLWEIPAPCFLEAWWWH